MSVPTGRLQWGDYIAQPSSPVDATGRTRWEMKGPGVKWGTTHMTRDEARASLLARLRVAGLDFAEVPVAWAEAPRPVVDVTPGDDATELPAWAVTDRTTRLPACIIVGCGTHRYKRGLCWAHFDAVTQAGIKERVALPAVRGSRGGR